MRRSKRCQSTLEALRHGGHLYGLPLKVAPGLLLVDPQLLAEARVSTRGRVGPHSLPEPWTWDTLEEVVARLTQPAGDDGAVAQWGFAPAETLPLDALLWQHGAEIREGGARGMLGAGGPGGGSEAEAGKSAQLGRSVVQMDPAAARATLQLYARLLRAILGPAAERPHAERPAPGEPPLPNLIRFTPDERAAIGCTKTSGGEGSHAG